MRSKFKGKYLEIEPVGNGIFYIHIQVKKMDPLILVIMLSFNSFFF